MGETHTLVRSSTEGYFWRLTVKKVELAEADKYGQRKIVGELGQEVGGNTQTQEEMWEQLANAKRNLGVMPVA